MKKFFSVLAVLLCAISLVIFSCGGGGGGAGGGTAGTSSGSSSGAGGSAVSIRFNGLYARSAGTVWDTIDYLDLKIFVDGAEVFSKHLTASDNVVLVEHLTPGSTAYATGSLRYNEMNGGAEGNIVSDQITLERGSNTLTLNVVYTYELHYITDDTGSPGSASGTYTAAGGIPLPADFHTNYNGDTFTGWLDMRTETDRYPANFAGIRGNVKLDAIYEQVSAGTFNITYHFERNGQTISNSDAIVYTYMPAMGSFEGYPYTCDIKCVIDSSEVPFTDCYLDVVGGYSPVNSQRIEGEDNSILFYTSANTPISEGTYVVKSADGRTSAQTITIYKVDTIAINGNTMSFTEFDPNATDLRYVINNTTITSINPDSVTPLVRNVLRYLEIMGSGITEIPASCFEDCTALNTVMFPSSLTKVYKSAFKGVSASFYFDSNPTNGSIQFNVDATDATESSFVTNVSGYWNNIEYKWRSNNAWE